MDVAKNQAERKHKVIQAEMLLRIELQKFEAWQESLKYVPTISRLQAKMEKVRAAETAKTMKKAQKKVMVINRFKGAGLLGKLGGAGLDKGSVFGKGAMDAMAAKAEEEALRQGVAAVEIVPDGSEAQACVAAVEGSYATVEAAGAVAAVAECVVADGDFVAGGDAVVAVAAEPVG